MDLPMKWNACAMMVLFAFLSNHFVEISSAQNSLNNDDDEYEDSAIFEVCKSQLIHCSCYDLNQLEKSPFVKIVCSTINSSFPQILSNGSIFAKNTNYEITITGMQHIPRSFTGLRIFRLVLDNAEMIEIEKDAFDGATKVTRFHVFRSSIEGTFKVKILDFSNNNLTSLPPNLLDGMKSLRKIVLSHNQLLHVDNLFAVIHPKIIFLDFNNLTNVESILHLNMLNVKTLYLSSNPIEKLSMTSFNKKIPKVFLLYLDHCKILEFNASHFEHLTELKELDLSWNRIKNIPQQIIDFKSKVILNLTGNHIEKFEATMSPDLLRLHLDHNRFNVLGRSLWYSQPVQVTVSFNALKYLREDDFRGVHGTDSIKVSGNNIRWIDKKTFLFLRKDLHHLDLSTNLITSINGSLTYLSQLLSVNLSANHIRSIEEDEFIDLTELSELYLKHNLLIAVGTSFKQMPQLQFLDVRNNRLESLSPIQVPRTLQYIYLAGNAFKCDCKLLPFLLWMNISDSARSDVSLCASPGANNLDKIGKSKACPAPCDCFCTEDGEERFLFVNCSSRNLTVLPPFLTKERENLEEVQDINDIFCSFEEAKSQLKGKLIWSLNDLELCPTEITGYLISSAVLSIFLIYAGGIIFYQRNPMRVMAWLCAHGFPFVKEEDLDKDKEYDAFFSFANEDTDLIHKLESAVSREKPQTKTCIHARDFPAGAFILDNIMDSIHNSKRTFAFLSNNFLKSHWCKTEFQIAFFQSQNDYVDRIIVIKMGYLTEEIPKIIETHMKEKTYLIWEEENFLHRFLSVLPVSKMNNDIPDVEMQPSESQHFLEC